jgi:hypothetical protein
VQLTGRKRHQLRDVDARHRRGDCPERSAGIGARLGIPALELAQPTVLKDEKDSFRLRLELSRHQWPKEEPGPEEEARGEASKEESARHPVLGEVAARRCARGARIRRGDCGGALKFVRVWILHVATPAGPAAGASGKGARIADSFVALSQRPCLPKRGLRYRLLRAPRTRRSSPPFC